MVERYYVTLMDIDVVYLWVDGGDPVHRALRRLSVGTEPHMNVGSNDESRFSDHGELRYSLRSLEMFAPWVRRVYIVTGGQCPRWLHRVHPQVRIVDHREIFPDASVLPTFNSTVIELYLDRIPGLSEHFLFFNDDCFLGDVVEPGTFFTGDGSVRIAFTQQVCPEGNPYHEELAWISGLKNANALLDRRFGKERRMLPIHQARPLRKSICRRFRCDFPAACHRAATHRFRSTSDIMFTWCVHPYYALHGGEGVRAEIRNRWVGLEADPRKNRVQYECLLQERPSLFCLNDQGIGEDPLVLGGLCGFLDAYFPCPSSFECVEATSGEDKGSAITAASSGTFPMHP